MTTTKTTTIPRELIVDALDAAGVDPDLREDYSGRGMFGDCCGGSQLYPNRPVGIHCTS